MQRALAEVNGIQEIDELVAEWTPDPLVDPLTELEAAMNENQLVIVG